MNPYLKRLRERYDGLKSGMEGLQTRAAEEGRDLTEDELRSIKESGEQAKTIATQIEDLTDIETRSRKVAGLAASLDDGEQTQTRSVGTSNTSAKDRDPGHYRSETEGGQHSFFADLYRSRTNGDEAAATRLIEHNRALSTGAQGVGIVPPKWLSEEYDPIARQGRRLPVRTIPLGDDPRPITLPKQIAGTDAVVADQANENDPVGGADAYNTDVDTVVPKPTAGKQTVSRQMLDMSSPAVDQLIYGDLLDVFDDKVEAKIGAALVAAAGAAVTTLANEAAFTAAAAVDSVVDLSTAVLGSRKRPADILAMTVNRWGKFKKLKDTTGRQLIPSGSGGPMNVLGVGTVNTLGQLEDLGVVASDGIGNGTYPESFLAYRSMDQVLFLTNVLRFRFEEVSGPESVVLGVWGYTAFISRQAGKSVKRVVVSLA